MEPFEVIYIKGLREAISVIESYEKEAKIKYQNSLDKNDIESSVGWEIAITIMKIIKREIAKKHGVLYASMKLGESLEMKP